MTAQVPIYNLRSNTSSKRPQPSGLAFGQIAINYNQDDPAIYLRGHSDDLVKVAPVFVGTTAPNATPASGGASGNAIGEQWLDTTGGDYSLKTWDGTAWREQIVTSSLIKNGTIVDGDINASAAIALTKLGNGALPTGITVNSENIVNGSIVNADIHPDAAISLSKLDVGALPAGITVASSNIVNDTIVDADINASAAIGLSKLATGALPTGITVNSGNIIGNYAKFDENQTFSKAQRGAIVALATSGTVTADFGASNNFSINLAGNVTFAFPSGVVSGQSGAIRIEQGGTFTVAYASGWEFPGGVAPSNTTVSGSSDLLVYYAHSNTAVTAQLLADVG